MKLSLLITMFLTLSSYSMASDFAPNGNYVNAIVKLALGVDSEQLIKQDGKYACQSTMGDLTFAKNPDEAHAKSVLLCIKRKCSTIQSEVNQEIDRMRQQSLDEIEDLLASQGKEIDPQRVIEILRNGGYGGTTDCISSQSARYMIYDMCSLSLYTCGKVNSFK